MEKYHIGQEILKEVKAKFPSVAAFARELVETGTTRIILGHLSQHNNTPDCAEQAALSGLSGMQRNRDYILQVAAPTGLEKAVIF